MTAFVPGLELAAALYHETVAPILSRRFPGLVCSAALLGTGSEVLRFDTGRSTDHEWGPRLQIFVRESDHADVAPAIHDELRRALPPEIRGFPTDFGPPDDEGIRVLRRVDAGLIEHKVEVLTVPAFLADRLGIADWRGLTPVDWLLFSQQGLLEVTAGAVFHDGLGELEPARAAFAWYPSDVWLLLMAAQWTRIGQLEPFVGRSGEVGDEVGSALVAATLARDVMSLGFLLERRYAPYPKWFGSAFASLACAAPLLSVLGRVLTSQHWHEREAALCQAYEALAVMHNALGISAPLPDRVSQFHGRPFRVIHGQRFAEALRAAIADEAVRCLPEGIGGVDQWIDSTDVLSNADRRLKLRPLYTSAP